MLTAYGRTSSSGRMEPKVGCYGTGILYISVCRLEMRLSVD